jgi:hypothetical protein
MWRCLRRCFCRMQNKNMEMVLMFSLGFCWMAVIKKPVVLGIWTVSRRQHIILLLNSDIEFLSYLLRLKEVLSSNLFSETGFPDLAFVVIFLSTSRQLVKARTHRPEGRGFDSWGCHWDFSLTLSFRSHCGLGADSASNRNEYQEYFLGDKGGRCVRLTTLPFSLADCLEIREPQASGTLRACPGL